MWFACRLKQKSERCCGPRRKNQRTPRNERRHQVKWQRNVMNPPKRRKRKGARKNLWYRLTISLNWRMRRILMLRRRKTQDLISKSALPFKTTNLKVFPYPAQSCFLFLGAWWNWSSQPALHDHPAECHRQWPPEGCKESKSLEVKFYPYPGSKEVASNVVASNVSCARWKRCRTLNLHWSRCIIKAQCWLLCQACGPRCCAWMWTAWDQHRQVRRMFPSSTKTWYPTGVTRLNNYDISQQMSIPHFSLSSLRRLLPAIRAYSCSSGGWSQDAWPDGT